MVDAKHPWRGIRSFERHSLVLMVAGTVYVLIGVSYLVSDPTPSRIAALHYAIRVLDYNGWGYVFMLAGFLAILSSRWPPVSETWGYQALTGLGAGWAATYLAGILFADAPLQGISGFLSWGLIAFMWWAISGLINPNQLLAMLYQLRALQTENLELHKRLASLEEEEG